MFRRRSTALALILGFGLLAVSCSSDNTTPTSPSNPSNPSLVTIFIQNGVFSPNPTTINLGEQINWKNNDAIAHTATLTGTFDTGAIAPMSAADAPITLSARGTYNYHCSIHPNETGTIIVQ